MVRVSALPKRQIAEVSALWNEAVQTQGEGYEQHTLTAERLDEIIRDDNYLPSGAVVATDAGEVVGFALGYVQRVDHRREGNLEAMPARLAGIAVKPDHWRQGGVSRTGALTCPCCSLADASDRRGRLSY